MRLKVLTPKGVLTLRRPGQLLTRIYLRHGGRDLSPHCARAVPACYRRARWDFGNVVLRWTRVVYLLSRDVVDGSSSRNCHNVGCIARLVAANVGSGWILDALLRIFVFRNACCGPILFFGFSVDN
jgi:hypothetical protein